MFVKKQLVKERQKKIQLNRNSGKEGGRGVRKIIGVSKGGRRSIMRTYVQGKLSVRAGTSEEQDC